LSNQESSSNAAADLDAPQQGATRLQALLQADLVRCIKSDARLPHLVERFRELLCRAYGLLLNLRGTSDTEVKETEEPNLMHTGSGGLRQLFYYEPT